ncbi:MAG: HEAT repeat domain-containing protein [Phycisphaerae bacterium]
MSTSSPRPHQGAALKGRPGRAGSAPACLCLLAAMVLLTGCSDEDADDSATSELLRDLSSSSPETRIAAARRLGVQRQRRAVEPLTSLLEDIRPDVRKAAAQALGRIGDPRAVKPLASAMNREDADGEFRRLCAGALGSIADDSAVPALSEAMRSDDEELAFAAAFAVAEIGRPALDSLLDGLHAEKVHTRRAAATALGRVPGDRAREAMRDLLDDPDGVLRLAAAENLAAMSETEETGRIVAMLLDDDETVRRGMPRVILQLGDDAIPALAEIIATDERTVERTNADGEPVEVSVRWAQSQAAHILIETESAEAIGPLIAALDRPISNRKAVREHLRRRFGDQQGREELLRLCTQGDAHRRDTAFMLLYEFIGERFLAAENDQARRRIMEQAGLDAPAELVAVCRSASESNDEVVRFRASLLLCAMGNPQGRDTVERAFWRDIETLRDRQWQRSDELDRARKALTALSTVADRQLGDKLVPLLREGAGAGKDWDGLRGRMATVLGRIGDESYTKPLLKFLKGRTNDHAASRAARSLGRIGAADAFDDILRFVGSLHDDMYFVDARRNCYEGLLGCDHDRAYREIGRILTEQSPHNSAGIENIVNFYKDHPDPAAVEPLMHWVNHDVRLIRENIHEGLVAVGRADLSWLIEGFETESASKRSTLAGVIADGFGREAVPALVEAAADDSPRKRQGAVWALGCIGGAEASDAVAEAMADPHDAVRSAAAWSAGRLRNPEHLPAMVDLLEDPATDVRSMAARKLGDMGSQEAVEPLIGALDDDAPEVRGYAILSLTALRAREALEPIRNLLDDPDPDVRAAAAYAAENLPDRSERTTRSGSSDGE